MRLKIKGGSTSTKSKGGASFSEVVSNNKGQQQPLDKNKNGPGGKATDQQKKRKAGATSATGGRGAVPDIVIPAYDYYAYFEMTIWIAAGTTKIHVVDQWENYISEGLDMFHKFDKSVCILMPKDREGGKRIYCKSDFPELWRVWKDYMIFENEELFKIPAPQDRKQRMSCSLMLGMK